MADEEALEMASTAKVRRTALRASLSLFALSFCLQPEGCDGRGEGLSKEREKGGTPSVGKSLSRVTSHPHLSCCVYPPPPPQPARPVPLGQAIQPLTEPALDKDQELSSSQTLTL